MQGKSPLVSCQRRKTDNSFQESGNICPKAMRGRDSSTKEADCWASGGTQVKAKRCQQRTLIRVTQNVKSNSKKMCLPHVRFGDTVRPKRAHPHDGCHVTVNNSGTRVYLLTWGRARDLSSSRKVDPRRKKHIRIEMAGSVDPRC